MMIGVRTEASSAIVCCSVAFIILLLSIMIYFTWKAGCFWCFVKFCDKSKMQSASKRCPLRSFKRQRGRCELSSSHPPNSVIILSVTVWCFVHFQLLWQITSHQFFFLILQIQLAGKAAQLAPEPSAAAKVNSGFSSATK